MSPQQVRAPYRHELHGHCDYCGNKLDPDFDLDTNARFECCSARCVRSCIELDYFSFRPLDAIGERGAELRRELAKATESK